MSGDAAIDPHFKRIVRILAAKLNIPFSRWIEPSQWTARGVQIMLRQTGITTRIPLHEAPVLRRVLAMRLRRLRED
jgi:hypothetical protein